MTVKAISELSAGTPTRASNLVSSDGGGANYPANEVLGLIDLGDLPQSGAVIGQVMTWNGVGWVPATAGSTATPNGTIEATGDNQGGAATLTAIYTVVTSGAANAGILAPATTTLVRTVLNRTGATINLYPDLGAAFEGLATDAAAILDNGSAYDVVYTSSSQGYLR